jgi:DNA-binding SARP family transcriptional activator
LLDAEEFRGQAAFRLIQTYLSTGRQQKALNFYKKMSEMEIEDSWLVVSAQAVEIVN